MSGRAYWWLVARDETGKSFLIFGSDQSEEQARQKGLELLAGTDFEIKRFRTRNMARASQMLKGLKLEKTHDLHKSATRLGHERSIERLRRRRRSS